MGLALAWKIAWGHEMAVMAPDVRIFFQSDTRMSRLVADIMDKESGL